MRYSTIALHAVLGGVLIASPSAARAQEAVPTPVEPSAEPETTEAEIIVTAQRREERLQDVPISVTVFSADALERANIDSGTEIARQTPNLRVSVLGDESQPKFSMRGLSTSEFTLNSLSGTAIFYDEIYVGQSYLGGAQIYDLERVEVLRGPQGTLFGKNSTAGLVNFISQRPKYEEELEVSAGYGSYGYMELKGIGEAPLVEDKLSARLAFAGAHSNGYIENVNPDGKDLSNIDRASGRLSIGYKDDNGFNAVLRGFVVKNNARAIGAINKGLFGGLNAFGRNPRVDPFTGDPLSRHEVATDRSGVIEVRGAGANLTLTKEFGPFTLTSISSYANGRFLNTVDGDGTIDALLHIDFAAKAEEISQDIRISSAFDGPFQFAAGLYHQRDDVDIDTNFFLFAGFVDLTQTFNQKRRSYAGYVDGTFKIAPQVTLYGGLRYTDDKGRLENFRIDTIFAGTPLPTDSAPTKRYHDGSPTGRIGLRFEPTTDVMVYGQFARGYRSSAFNGGALASADLTVANPEKLDAFEVGLKSQLFDRTLTFNASAFLYNFSDQQFINVVGIGNQELVNAGNSRLKGIELELLWWPIRRLSFSAGLGLLDTEYRDTMIRDPIDGVNVDVSGNELIEAPGHTLNLGVDYSFPIAGIGDLRLHGDATHVGSQHFSATNRSEFFIKDFWDLNGRIAWIDPTDRFEVAVYGKNLTDNRVSTGVQIDPSTGTIFTTVPYPRRFGVELTARF